jgi:hypothetical protein
MDINCTWDNESDLIKYIGSVSMQFRPDFVKLHQQFNSYAITAKYARRLTARMLLNGISKQDAVDIEAKYSLEKHGCGNAYQHLLTRQFIDTRFCVYN